MSMYSLDRYAYWKKPKENQILLPNYLHRYLCRFFSLGFFVNDEVVRANPKTLLVNIKLGLGSHTSL